jgi:hypothetical protein
MKGPADCSLAFPIYSLARSNPYMGSLRICCGQFNLPPPTILCLCQFGPAGAAPAMPGGYVSSLDSSTAEPSVSASGE